MRLRERRGTKSRAFRALFKEAQGVVHLIARDWEEPPAARPLSARSFEISPSEARLYVVLEATDQELEHARKLFFFFVPLEPSIILLDEAGSELAGEIQAVKDGGALFVDGARVWPGEVKHYRFKAITPDQRAELRAFGYLVPE